MTLNRDKVIGTHINQDGVQADQNLSNCTNGSTTECNWTAMICWDD